MRVSALPYRRVSVYTPAHSRTLSPSRSVTNYLIKFHCIKATFMNLAQSQAHCSSANEIKVTFAFLPTFNYASGRTARAQRFNKERGKRRRKNRAIHSTQTVLWRENNLVAHFGSFIPRCNVVVIKLPISCQSCKIIIDFFF